MNSDPAVTVLLPAFNEEAAMPSVLASIRSVMDGLGEPYEILVVDDGSTDRTAEIARHGGARVVRHNRNRGNGRARKTGVREARAPVVVMTDADGTYPIQAIPEMLRMLRSCDMVVGARKIEAGTMRWLRSPAKNVIRRIASFTVGERIPDLNSGLRALRPRTVMKFMNILPDTHSWVSTITLAYMANEYDVCYLPIDYYPRIGRSTFHPIKDTYHYLMLVIRTVMFFNPLRFAVPLSAGLGLWGLAKFIWDWRVHSDVRESDIMILLTAVLVGLIGMLADLIVRSSRGRYLPDPGDRPGGVWPGEEELP